MAKKGHQKFRRMKRHILGEKSHGKVSLANNFLQSKNISEIGEKCFIVSGVMDAPDSTCYSNLLISCSISPNQSVNLQIKSRPSLKGKTHFMNEKNQKVSRFLKARKWSPYKMVTLYYTIQRS